MDVDDGIELNWTDWNSSIIPKNQTVQANIRVACATEGAKEIEILLKNWILIKGILY